MQPLGEVRGSPALLLDPGAEPPLFAVSVSCLRGVLGGGFGISPLNFLTFPCRFNIPESRPDVVKLEGTASWESIFMFFIYLFIF